MSVQNRGTWSWFFQRVSGSYLVMCMIVHYWFLHFFIEPPITMEKVIARVFSSPFWITFDFLFLLTAVFHALNGAWEIFLDWAPGPKTRRLIGWTLSLIGFVLAFVGIAILGPLSK